MRRFELTIDDRTTGTERRRVLIRYARSQKAAREAIAHEKRTIVSVRELGPVEQEQSEFIYGASYRGAKT